MKLEIIKHFLLLIPRLIGEYWHDYCLYRRRIEKNDGRLRVGMQQDDRLFEVRHGVGSLLLQAIGFHKSSTVSMLNGAETLLNRGAPVRILYDHIEDSIHKLNCPDIMDISGASYIANNKFPMEIIEKTILFDEFEITMDLLRKNKWNLSTKEVIVLLSFYKSAGRGLLWPHGHYNELYRIYLINFLLKPIHLDYRTTMALKVLSECTDNKLWKILYKLNLKFSPFEKWENYA